jgi:hypothetical protein
MGEKIMDKMVNGIIVKMSDEEEKALLDEKAKRKEAQDAISWKTNREAEYPAIAELTVALYDTDDKADIEAKREAVKAKFPKPE